MDAFAIIVGVAISGIAIAVGGMVYSIARTNIAEDCKRDGFVWVNGTKIECKIVPPKVA